MIDLTGDLFQRNKGAF